MFMGSVKNQKLFVSNGIHLKVSNTVKYGIGVFTADNIMKGQKIINLEGKRITFEECRKMVNNNKVNIDDPLQIGKSRFIVLNHVSRAFNHSCEPNAGLRKINELFALKNIKSGEEITYNYSTTVGPNIEFAEANEIKPGSWSMLCKCGSKNCRKVLGNILTLPPKTLEKYKKLGAIQNYIKRELKKNNKDTKKLTKIK
jgi:uncharacterized protein